jgi:hypothetical protein
MQVRSVFCVAALVLLFSVSASAQTFTASAPVGSAYAAATNFAVNFEGNRELLAPVSICTAVAGAGGTDASFDVGDQFRITYGSNVLLPGTPFTLPPGVFATSTGQVTVVGVGLAATATADTVATPTGPTAQVTITITSAPTDTESCVVVHNLRFDIAGTSPSIADAATITVAVSGVAGANQSGAAVPMGAPPLALGVGVPSTDIVASANNTFVPLGVGAGTGLVSATGTTTNPAATLPPSGFFASTVTIPTLIQNSGVSRTGTIDVVQDAATGTLSAALGGGLLRTFRTSGTNQSTFLNLSGATSATKIDIEVADMPAGSSVVFPDTVNSPSTGTAIITLTGGGTISAPGGTVTYSVSVNTSGTAARTVNVPFTVNSPSSGGGTGTARAIVRLRPAPTTSDIPRYAAINGVSVIPTQATPVPANSQVALFTIIPNTTNLLYPFVSVFDYPPNPNTFDTGVVVVNTGQDPFGTANATRTVGQDGTFTFYLFPDKESNGDNSVVRSIKSDNAAFPNAAMLETGGRLAQGNLYQALVSQILTAAGVPANANWRGYIIVITDFQYAQGFAFISQFYNANGGATMGYVANVFPGFGAGNSRATPETFGN